jgi:hypothetical protein
VGGGTFGVFQKSQIIADHRPKVGVFGAFWPYEVNILAIFGIKFMNLAIFPQLA